MQDFLVIYENVLVVVTVPFSLVRNIYLSAGVARRATRISTNMFLSSLRNVCEVGFSNKVADKRACMIYENEI